MYYAHAHTIKLVTTAAMSTMMSSTAAAQLLSTYTAGCMYGCCCALKRLHLIDDAGGELSPSCADPKYADVCVCAQTDDVSSGVQELAV